MPPGPDGCGEEEVLSQMVSHVVERACIGKSRSLPITVRAAQQSWPGHTPQAEAVSTADLIAGCVASALNDADALGKQGRFSEGGEFEGRVIRKIQRKLHMPQAAKVNIGDRGLRCSSLSRGRKHMAVVHSQLMPQSDGIHRVFEESTRGRSRSAVARLSQAEAPTRKSSSTPAAQAEDAMHRSLPSQLDCVPGYCDHLLFKKIRNRSNADATVRKASRVKKAVQKPSSSAADSCSETQLAGASSSSSAHRQKKRKAQIPTRDRASIWYGIFQRLMHEGEVHRDQLTRALDLGGFTEIVQDWVDQILEGISSCSTLDFEEYCSFVDSYKERAHRHYKEKFRLFDTNGSWVLDGCQLAALVASFCVKGTPHMIVETIAEIDEEGTDEFSFEDFVQAMKHISDREGFANTEYLRILRAFHDYDYSFSGRLSTKDVINVLGWLNFSTDTTGVVDTICQVDQEGKGEFNESMFLKVVGKLRDVEFAKIQEHLPDSHATGAERAVSYSRLENIWQHLGYIPDQEALHEAVEDAGFEVPCELSLGDVWKILAIYRDREGFSRSVSRDIEFAFDHVDTQKKRRINVLDVRRTLPFLGYVTPGEVHDLVLSLASQIDVSSSNILDFNQYKKLVRKYREWTMKRAEIVFGRFQQKAGEKLSLEACKIALKYMRCLDSDDEPVALVTHAGMEGDISDGIDKLTFVRTVVHYQWISREFVKLHAGYGISEVSGFRNQFHQYDTNKKGYVSRGDLLGLCSDILPQLTTSQKLRPRIMKFIKQSQTADEFTLDFSGFLQLARLDQEVGDAQRFEKERAIVQQIAFSSGKVKELRALFVDTDEDMQGRVSFCQFVGLLDGLSADQLQRLKILFSKVLPQHDLWESGVDFPEFLELIHGLAGMKIFTVEQAS